MKRRNFFKSFAALLGLAVVAPLELFKDSEIPPYLKAGFTKVGDFNLPDWVKKVKFYRTQNDRVSFIENGDGELVEKVTIQYHGDSKDWILRDEYSKFPKS